MSRVVRGLAAPLALAVALLAAGRVAAQGCAPPPAVAYYPPAVSYYAPPAVAYYPPPASVSYYEPPAVSYYAPPAVSNYPAPAVSYYAPAYPSATVTTRYGLFGRPRSTTVQYYAP